MANQTDNAVIIDVVSHEAHPINGAQEWVCMGEDAPAQVRVQLTREQAFSLQTTLNVAKTLPYMDTVVLKDAFTAHWEHADGTEDDTVYDAKWWGVSFRCDIGNGDGVTTPVLWYTVASKYTDDCCEYAVALPKGFLEMEL